MVAHCVYFVFCYVRMFHPRCPSCLPQNERLSVDVRLYSIYTHIEVYINIIHIVLGTRHYVDVRARLYLFVWRVRWNWRKGYIACNVVVHPLHCPNQNLGSKMSRLGDVFFVVVIVVVAVYLFIRTTKPYTSQSIHLCIDKRERSMGEISPKCHDLNDSAIRLLLLQGTA